MKFLIGLFIIIYEFLLVPMWLGALWSRKKKESGFCRLYAEGMVTLFTIFFCVAVFAGVKRMQLSTLTGWWKGLLIVSIFGMIISCVLQHKKIKNLGKKLIFNCYYAVKKMRGYLTFLVLVLLFSVTSTVPTGQDDTPEIVNIAVATDTIYEYQPYTKAPYDGVNMDKVTAPIEMLYSVNANITGIEPVVLIHTVLPAFFLLLYFCVCWQVGSYFFRDDLEKRELFVIFVTIFYTVALTTETSLVMGILQNPWNGISLAVSCGLPLVLIQGFRMMNYYGRKKRVPWQEQLKTVFMATAVQLMISKGYLVCILILSGCLVTSVCKKGMWNAGSVRKH